MKILFHHRIASRDGQSVHLEELFAALEAQGHDVVLVGPRLEVRFGGAGGAVAWLKRALPRSLWEIAEIAYNGPAFLRLYRAARTHRPDFIYERFSLLLVAGILVRKLAGIPILLEVNAPLYEERARNDRLALRRVGRRFQKFLWNGADGVLPVTGVLGDLIRGYGVPGERIHVIPNGINPARFAAIPGIEAAKAALSLQGSFVVGFTGFVRRWHGLERVIDFVAAHGERFGLHFLLVGDGPARDELLDHARACGVQRRFSITGVVGRDAVASHVACFDIALQPGVTEYASPLKLFEYMYLKRAIIAPATPNIEEILTHERDALLFDPAAPGAIDAALLRLCGDHALRARLGRQAQLTINEKSLTWAANAARVATLGRRLAQAEAAVRTQRGAGRK